MNMLAHVLNIVGCLTVCLPLYFAHHLREICERVSGLILVIRLGLPRIQRINRYRARFHFAFEIRPAVYVADFPYFVKAAKLKSSVLIDRRPYVFAIVAVFHFLQKLHYYTLLKMDYVHIFSFFFCIFMLKMTCLRIAFAVSFIWFVQFWS